MNGQYLGDALIQLRIPIINLVSTPGWLTPAAPPFHESHLAYFRPDIAGFRTIFWAEFSCSHHMKGIEMFRSFPFCALAH